MSAKASFHEKVRSLTGFGQSGCHLKSIRRKLQSSNFLAPKVAPRNVARRSVAQCRDAYNVLHRRFVALYDFIKLSLQHGRVPWDFSLCQPCLDLLFTPRSSAREKFFKCRSQCFEKLRRQPIFSAACPSEASKKVVRPIFSKSAISSFDRV